MLPKKLKLKKNLRAVNPKTIKLEREIVKLLYEGNSDIVELAHQYIKPEDFTIEVHSKLAELIFDAFLKDEDIIASSLIEKINDEKIKEYLIELTFEKYSISKSWDDIYPDLNEDKKLFKIALDTLKDYKLLQIQQKIIENNKTLEDTLDEEERLEIMKTNLELMKDKEMLSEEFKNKETS